MIRVIYRWQVDAGREAEFLTWWHDGTVRIRSTFSGAMGSTLLAPEDGDRRFVAVARWRSRAQLEAFWKNPGGAPFDGAVAQPPEVLEELDDLTLVEPPKN